MRSSHRACVSRFVPSRVAKNALLLPDHPVLSAGLEQAPTTPSARQAALCRRDQTGQSSFRTPPTRQSQQRCPTALSQARFWRRGRLGRRQRHTPPPLLKARAGWLLSLQAPPLYSLPPCPRLRVLPRVPLSSSLRVAPHGRLQLSWRANHRAGWRRNSEGKMSGALSRAGGRACRGRSNRPRP